MYVQCTMTNLQPIGIKYTQRWNTAVNIKKVRSKVIYVLLQFMYLYEKIKGIILLLLMVERKIAEIHRSICDWRSSQKKKQIEGSCFKISLRQ